MGDLVFLGSCNGLLHAVDRDTGLARWTYDANLDGGEPEFHGQPLVTANLIVVASDDRRPAGIGHLYAFDRSTLRVAWKLRMGSGLSTGLIEYRNLVYGVTLSDELIAVELSTGALRWRFASGASNEQYLLNSTPAVSGDRVVFGGLDGSVHALDAKSGAPLWRRNLGARVSTSILAVGRDLYVADGGGFLHRLDAASGASKAQLHIDGNASFKLVAVGESLLFFVNQTGGVAIQSVPLTLDRVVWSTSAPGPGWTSFALPHVWRDWVVAGQESGEIVALRVVDGGREWEGKVTGRIAGIGGDETALYLGTTNGTLYRYPLPLEVMGPPVGRRDPPGALR